MNFLDKTPNDNQLSYGSQLDFPSLNLHPYRVTDTLNMKIYEFWRGNPKGDKPKELAMIVLNKDRTHFTLQYYPLDSKDLQVVKDLPLSKLREAAENLKGAGFI